MDVVQVDGTSEKRCNLGRSETRDAAADTCDKEGHLRMHVGETDELLDVWQDGVRAALHGGDGIADRKSTRLNSSH